MLHIPHLIGSADEKSGLEHCTDEVSSTFPAATETGLSVMVDRDVSHDPISPFLSAQD